VKSLLKGDHVELLDPIDPVDIADFRDRHSDTAFPCQYRYCSKYSSGFHTAQERETHELSHRPRIRCPIASCEFHVLGFSSQQCLERHNLQYHTGNYGKVLGSQGTALIRKKFDLALRKSFVESDPTPFEAKRLKLESLDDSLLALKSDVEKLINESRAELYETGFQTKVKVLFDLQVILQSQTLPPDQISLIQNQVAQFKKAQEI
jgi:hypothetical protein